MAYSIARWHCPAVPAAAVLVRGRRSRPGHVADADFVGGARGGPHGADAPEETRFPAPLTASGDGPIALPAAKESHDAD